LLGCRGMARVHIWRLLGWQRGRRAGRRRADANRIVFNPEFNDKLRNLFEGIDDAESVRADVPQVDDKDRDRAEGKGEAKGRFKTSGFKSSFVPLASISAEKSGAVGGVGKEAGDLDGEEMDMDGEDLDGEDMDGEAMEMEVEDEDVDGEAM
jgi:U2-associated protein SR140